ncbi:MAG TPA: beta-ketoacyl-ACP synthase III [Thermoanaerobaculia bacterium]|nr:beta-ketoacyl-ACP synthase III [Thermoanaerobaculia bacterium]
MTPSRSVTTVVRGTGIHLPDGIVTNARLSRLMDTSDEWIVQRTGIRERRFARRGTSSVELGAEAARRALEDAGLAARDVDLIVFATMTPAHYFPGNGGLLAARLGLSTTHALDIRMQCAGFLSGLQVADAFIRSGGARRVLLVGAECHAAFFPWSDEDWAILFGESEAAPAAASYAWGTAHRDRAVLFGDAGGAFVLEANDTGDGRGFLGFEMRTDGNEWNKLYVPGGGSASFPYFSPEMFADNGTIPIVEGRQVFRLAATALPEIVREILERHALAVSDLALLLTHQANLRINEAVQKALGLPDERVFNNIQRYGNTTAATLPLVFHEAKREGRIRSGDVVGFAALGAGLHWGAGLLRV